MANINSILYIPTSATIELRCPLLNETNYFLLTNNMLIKLAFKQSLSICKICALELWKLACITNTKQSRLNWWMYSIFSMTFFVCTSNMFYIFITCSLLLTVTTNGQERSFLFIEHVFHCLLNT